MSSLEIFKLFPSVFPAAAPPQARWGTGFRLVWKRTKAAENETNVTILVPSQNRIYWTMRCEKPLKFSIIAEIEESVSCIQHMLRLIMIRYSMSSIYFIKVRDSMRHKVLFHNLTLLPKVLKCLWYSVALVLQTNTTAAPPTVCSLQHCLSLTVGMDSYAWTHHYCQTVAN